jgi:formylmethanofuran dehydrogenase subunit D
MANNGDMNNNHFVLIAGRTSQQGCGISEGKHSEGYVTATTVLQVSPEDFAALGLVNGDRVRLVGQFGEVEVAVAASRAGELPSGILFIAYGDRSSHLMGGDTHGSGMPTSKGIDVVLEKLS